MLLVMTSEEDHESRTTNSPSDKIKTRFQLFHTTRHETQPTKKGGKQNNKKSSLSLKKDLWKVRVTVFGGPGLPGRKQKIVLATLSGGMLGQLSQSNTVFCFLSFGIFLRTPLSSAIAGCR